MDGACGGDRTFRVGEGRGRTLDGRDPYRATERSSVPRTMSLPEVPTLVPRNSTCPNSPAASSVINAALLVSGGEKQDEC